MIPGGIVQINNLITEVPGTVKFLGVGHGDGHITSWHDTGNDRLVGIPEVTGTVKFSEKWFFILFSFFLQ